MSGSLPCFSHISASRDVDYLGITLPIFLCRSINTLMPSNLMTLSLHSEKTRIVHVDHGFEFLGYKVKRGKGLRLSARKRTSHANPLNLYAVPREKSVHR